MKKINKRFIMLLIILLMLVGCGSSKEIDGVDYETYGFINRDEIRNPKIKYQIVTGNVVWGIILCVAPVYFFGFSLYEPVKKLEQPKQ